MPQPWPTITRLSILRAAADAGGAQRRPVDRAVGADLDVVLDDTVPTCGILRWPVGTRDEAEAVAADDRAGVQRDPVADHDALADHGAARAP